MCLQMKHHFAIKGQFEAYSSSQLEPATDAEFMITMQVWNNSL
jgi:hypothetical protein